MKTTNKKTEAVVKPAPEPHNWTNGSNEVLILRRTGQDRKSHNGFIYPAGVGSTVAASDFNEQPKCGGGLHGWPWGFGLGEGQDFDVSDDLWIVLGAKPEDVIGNLEGGWKCKCRTATIRFEGKMKDAIDRLRGGFTACVQAMAAHVPANTQPSHGNYATNASSGDSAKNASSGNSAKNASSGNSAKNASSGDYATNASSGDSAKNASSGYGGEISASGKESTAAMANEAGRVKVGEGGAFALAYKDAKGWNFAVGRVGENGIKANQWYKVGSDGKLVEG